MDPGEKYVEELEGKDYKPVKQDAHFNMIAASKKVMTVVRDITHGVKPLKAVGKGGNYSWSLG